MAQSGLTKLATPELARSAGLSIDDWQAWWDAITQPETLIEIGVIAVCGLLAWALVQLLQRGWRADAQQVRAPILLGHRGFDGALFPLLWLGLTWVASLVMARLDMVTLLFRIALPALIALAAIRLGVKVLRQVFPGVHGVRMLERTLSWLGWIGVVLWVSGLLPVLLEEADGVSWQFGEDDLTLRELIEGVLNVGLALLLALWLSSVVENRLLRGAVGSNLSLRKVLAQGLRALLVFMAVLVALTAVGIDLTALSVFGGAIGVGIGLGLQRLAANYVSGFVVLTERAVRIGDMVRVDGFEGQVTDIRARYTVVRALSGRESIVPNEMMVTQRIENMSLADRRISQSTVVSVAYDADPEQVQQLLRQAALSCERVLRQPAPSALLTGFGADGLEFTVGYWMDEPTAGQLGLRSEVNLAILAALREHGIDIPYPQRVVHQLQVPSAVPPPSPHAEPAPPLSVA